ncbi:MAG: hypothetical protein KDD69_00400 [Bdellovibrionales bacterium]|nr:hypothetical protein [Bdellovibrionales bacterium]
MIEQVLNVLASSLQLFGDHGLTDALPGAVRLSAGTSEYLGGVGHAVAAALQTKGLIDQAKILSDFKESLEWIAALGWLFSIGMAIGSVAVFGGYRQAAYLLIGPPLFYWMITTTATTDGTRTVIGNREVPGGKADQSRLLNWIRAIDEGDGTADISFFFAAFDSLVTEAVQTVVAVLMDTDNMQDLRMVARERALAFALMGLPDNAPLTSLIATYHMGACGDALSNLIPAEGDPGTMPVDRRPKDEIERAESRVKDIKWEEPSVRLSPDVVNFLIGMRGARTNNNGGTFSAVPFEDQYEERPVSCEQIWFWTRDSILNIATDRLDPETFQASFGDDNQYPWEEAYEDVREWLQGRTGQNDPVEILAVYIYKNAISMFTASALQGNVFTRTPSNAHQDKAVLGNVQDAEAHGGYFKLRYFATSVPYIQGLLLYLLSIAFPFFAILLVLPGKATTFFAWCGLWVWVKSWDIGFALVHVARDIFWHMMKGRVNTYQTSVDWDFPSAVLSVAFNNDPFFTHNTLWIIVSAMTLSVPILTAHLCLGATGMFDMFKYSIDATANRFGQVESNRARRHHANKIESEQRQRLHDAKMLYGLANFHNGAATTAGGYKLGLLDGNLGGLYGGTEGSSNARPAQAAAGYDIAGFLIQNSDSAYRSKLRSQVAATERQEALANANLQPGQTPKTAAHVMRGMIDSSQRMPTELGWQRDENGTPIDKDGDGVPDQRMRLADTEEFKRLFADAPDDVRQRAANGEMTWDEFFTREGQIQDDLGDMLAATTRRRQYVQHEGTGAGAIMMRDVINSRQMVDSWAHSPVDDLQLRDMPALNSLLSFASGGASRPGRPGLPGFNGDAWMTPFVATGKAGGDEDAEDNGE